MRHPLLGGPSGHLCFLPLLRFELACGARLNATTLASASYAQHSTGLACVSEFITVRCLGAGWRQTLRSPGNAWRSAWMDASGMGVLRTERDPGITPNGGLGSWRRILRAIVVWTQR
jgi:hypothetical protein